MTRRFTRFSFVFALVIFVSLSLAFPIGYSIWLSFRAFDLKSLITGESDFVGISNYINVLGEATFRKAAVNTLIFLTVSMSMQYAIGLALALFFVRSFPLSKVLRAMLVLPWLAPAIVSTTAWRFIFREPLGFMNQVLAAIGFGPIPWLTSPNFSLACRDNREYLDRHHVQHGPLAQRPPEHSPRATRGR